MPRPSKAPKEVTPFDRIAKWLDGSRTRMMDLMAELTKRNAVGPVNGGPGEAEKADFLESYLAAEGFPAATRLTAMCDGVARPNLLVRLPGRDRSRCLWVMTHLDVVPPGNLSEWKSDPFALRVEGEKLVGRGVEDNHQGLVGSVFAARALLELGIEPATDVGLLFVADEETGSEYGIRWLLAQHPTLFSAGDAFLVPDAGNEDGSLVEVAEKAILWLKFRTVGRQVHASTPQLGVNAFVAASHLVVRLRDLYQRFEQRNPIFDPPMSTFEPTRKERNVENINTVPGEDLFFMDCRILPEVSVEEVLQAIRTLCDEVARSQRVVVHFDTVQREDAAPPTPADAPLVQQVIHAVQKVYRVHARPRGIGGGTVASALRHHGFPAVVWSRMDETGHQPNEYIWLSNLVDDAKVFALVMMGADASK